MNLYVLDFPDDLLLELLSSWLGNDPHTLVQMERTLRVIFQRSLANRTIAWK